MKGLITSLLCILALNTFAADKVTIIVQAGVYERKDCAVSADVSGLVLQESSSVELYEEMGTKKRAVPCQLVWEHKSPRIYWILDGKTAPGAKRRFVVQKVAEGQSSTPFMSVEDTQEALVVKKNGQSVLQYNYTHRNPPAGVAPSYGRSGFIHPAYSPAGNVLTAIQPKDHYHHYGIWNPWTRLEYDGQVYDLWNLMDKQGTVKARNIEEIWQGTVFSGYAASLEHFIFKPQKEKVVMNELCKVKVWNNNEGFLWDFESYLQPSTDLSIRMKEYRYGGFTFRATEEWTKANCEMLTSEGKTRQQIDGSTAHWIYVTGDTPTGRSGLLLMEHPGNYNSPEPLRIWDENANGGRGDVFINFAPAKNKDWTLDTGKQYVLRYRLLSYEGEMTKERADRLWNDFAYPPVVIEQRTGGEQ